MFVVKLARLIVLARDRYTAESGLGASACSLTFVKKLLHPRNVHQLRQFQQ